MAVPPLGGAYWPRNIGAFVISYRLGAWAMLGLGMVIASLFHNAKVAAGFGSFLFFVMQFFVGVCIQRPNTPTWLRDISNFTPGGAAVHGFNLAMVWGPLVLVVAAVPIVVFVNVLYRRPSPEERVRGGRRRHQLGSHYA